MAYSFSILLPCLQPLAQGRFETFLAGKSSKKHLQLRLLKMFLLSPRVANRGLNGTNKVNANKGVSVVEPCLRD
jgi:hypothetical protein